LPFLFFFFSLFPSPPSSPLLPLSVRPTRSAAIHPRREVAPSQLPPPSAPPPRPTPPDSADATACRCLLPSSAAPAPPPGPPPRPHWRLLPFSASPAPRPAPPAPARLHRGLRPASASSLLPSVAAAATRATCGATVGKGGRSRVEPRNRGSTSPSEAARCSSGSSTHGAVAKPTVWEGSAWSRSWSRSRSPPKQALTRRILHVSVCLSSESKAAQQAYTQDSI
jgi:hypothetical protein